MKWKCTCGWTGPAPVVAYDENGMVEIFCPVNCGKEPSFTGKPEELTDWWNDWYARQTEEVTA